MTFNIEDIYSGTLALCPSTKFSAPHKRGHLTLTPLTLESELAISPIVTTVEFSIIYHAYKFCDNLFLEEKIH